MGLPWRGVKGAPVYLLNLLQKKKAKDLHRLVCGSLPSGAIKVGKLRKGDVFIVDFKPNEKYLETLQRKGEDVSGRRFSIKTWGIMTSVSKQSEIKSLMFKDRKSYQPLAADTIAELLDLPIPAAELAAKMHLTSPK